MIPVAGGMGFAACLTREIGGATLLSPKLFGMPGSTTLAIRGMSPWWQELGACQEIIGLRLNRPICA